MTDYVKNTDYAAKDALISGNPAKLIKGTELGAEFDDIATAIATKADLNSPVLVTPNIGTPSAGTLTNCTGLPVSTGISGLGTGVATFLATPSSSNLASAVTGETGSGALVFGTSPTIATPAITGATTISTSSGDALTVTNTGTGNSLVIEDAANPDSTPFIVDASGQVIKGHTVALDGYVGVGTRSPNYFNSVGLSAATNGYGVFSYGATSALPRGTFCFNRSEGTSIGTHTALTSGCNIGSILWSGSDGTQFIPAAKITAFCDGTTGTNDMPGSLVFYTTADGAAVTTEAMRIDSAQKTTFSGVVKLKSYTVATLPTGVAGDTAFVTDANATTFASIVAGGGANGVPVYSDGTNWRIG